MQPTEKALLRHMYAAVAMHAMIIADSQTGGSTFAVPNAPGTAQPADSIDQISSHALSMADAMIEKGGPIE